MAEVDKDVDALVAHLPGVRDAVAETAREIAARAERTLAEHTHTGTARIEVTRGRTDTTVDLVDDAALSIEYGHQARNGRQVPGLYVITRAAGL